MNTFDLQIQSTASDGTHTPEEIVSMAHECGVLVIAMTDHDTVAGVAEAAAAGVEQGVCVIPGIELSVEEHGLHILGYGIDCANEKLVSEKGFDIKLRTWLVFSQLYYPSRHNK